MDWLVELDPVAYTNFIVVENIQRVLYLVILKAIYGILEASLLWYRKLRKDLESVGFKFNVYDACVANRMEKNDNIPLDSMRRHLIAAC